MSTTTRTRTKPAEDAGTDEAPAVPDFSTKASAAPAEERRPLFSVDGEEFTVPVRVTDRMVFLGMNAIRTEGNASFASMRLMELVLGQGQYTRLTELYEQEALDEDQFKQVVDMVSRIFFDHFSDTEGAEGKAGGTGS